MKQLSEPTPAVALAVSALLVGIWGTTWAAVRISLDGYPPLLGISMRFALGSALLLILARAWGVDLRPDRRLAAMWLVQSAFAFGISYGLVYWAEQWVPSGLVAVLFSTLPFFVVLFSYPLLPVERLDGLGLFGLVVGFGGVAVIFSDDLAALGGEQVRFAAMVVLIAPFSAGFAQVAIKKWGQGYHSLALTAPPMGLSALVMGGLSLVVEADRAVPGGTWPTVAVFYLGVFGSALAFSLFFWLLQHVSAIRMAMVAYAMPVVAVAVGTLFLNETLTWTIAMGAGLVILGVVFVARPRAGS
ncbi:MAG: EamA family transporter [Acidobacteriota bacterium]